MGGRRGRDQPFETGKDGKCLLTVLEVAIGSVIPECFKESFSKSSAVWFEMAFPRACEDDLFLDDGPAIMAFDMGSTITQPVLGDKDPSAISSTVVASSSADDNRTAMGIGACTLKSKLGGNCAGGFSLLWVPDCSRELDRVRSGACGPLLLHFCEPLCFVDGLWEADGDAPQV